MERESQNGAFEAKVMTDEQMEILRQQIAVYAAICEQLVLLHKSLSSSHDPFSGARLGGNPYFDPLVSSSSLHRLSTRHRWTPTAAQLQILENIYEEGNGTPNKQKIKEIATELARHGQITETNVYNWFQNRRARSKRKTLTQTQTQTQRTETVQAAVAAEEEENNGGESEREGDEGSGVKWRSGSLESYEHILFPSPDLGIEHLLGKAEAPGEQSSFRQAEG